MQALVVRAALSASAASGAGSGWLGGRYWPNPVDCHTDAYQYGAQTPSVSRGPGGQRSIWAENGTPSAGTARAAPPRAVQQVVAVDHRPAEPVEDLGLLPQAEVVQGWGGPHPGVGGQQLGRIPDQERVP